MALDKNDKKFIEDLIKPIQIDIDKIKKVLIKMSNDYDEMKGWFDAYNNTYDQNYGELKRRVDELEQRSPPTH